MSEDAAARSERCSYCGCVLAYKASRAKTSLATREQQSAIVDELRAAGGWENVKERWKERIAPCGYREAWVLSSKCIGCGRTRGRFKPEYTQAEAEALAAERSQAAETEAALQDAADWRGEVRRRAERDARTFAELLLARFPEWEPYIRFVGPDEPGDPLQWQCALEARVPCPNPAVEEPLAIRVLGQQVLPCWVGGWHAHLERADDAVPGDPAHLHRALELITDLVTEQIVVTTRYHGDQVLASGNHRIGHEAPAPRFAALMLEIPATNRHVWRSWRGTHDRDLPLTPCA